MDLDNVRGPFSFALSYGSLKKDHHAPKSERLCPGAPILKHDDLLRRSLSGALLKCHPLASPLSVVDHEFGIIFVLIKRR